MLYASIHIDLPSEEILRRKTAWDWIAGLIGREPNLGTGEELSTATGVAVLERIVAALTHVGITDVLSVTVDRKVAYVDTEESSGDLATAVTELDARHVLDQPFETMQLVLSHRAEGLHTLVEVRLERRVRLAQPELHVDFAARVEAMRVRGGDDPEALAARLRALVNDGATVAGARDRLAVLVDGAAEALTTSLGELALSTTVDPVTLRLIRPGARALAHFRHLTWGPAVRPPNYRPVPIRQRYGAYNEPFYHHYFDPYFDFVAWVVITELVAGRGWSGLDYEVVDETGERVFAAADAAGQAAVGGGWGGTVPVRMEGSQLIVDPVVPELGGVDPGEIADPRLVLGFGGDTDGGMGAALMDFSGGTADTGGGDAGGCGSSCGGCGSSCGG